MNNAAGVRAYKNLFEFLVSVLLSAYPCEIVGSRGNSILIFVCVCGAMILISVVAASFYIATHSAQWFSFLHILVNTCIIFCCFDSVHFNGCDVVSCRGFDWDFPND